MGCCMTKKNTALFLVLVTVLLFIFSPLFSELCGFLSPDKGLKQRLGGWRKACVQYWNEQNSFKRSLEKGRNAK